MKRPVLKNGTIQGIIDATSYQGGVLRIHFESVEAMQDFFQWLDGLREDAKKTPSERYDEFRVQMADSTDPARAE